MCDRCHWEWIRVQIEPCNSSDHTAAIGESGLGVDEEAVLRGCTQLYSYIKDRMVAGEDVHFGHMRSLGSP